MFTDPIQCQSGDSTLNLKYWMTGSTQIQVCLLDSQTNTELKPCQSLDKVLSPGPAHISIKGPVQRPFRVRFPFFIVYESSFIM